LAKGLTDCVEIAIPDEGLGGFHESGLVAVEENLFMRDVKVIIILGWDFII